MHAPPPPPPPPRTRSLSAGQVPDKPALLAPAAAACRHEPWLQGTTDAEEKVGGS